MIGVALAFILDLFVHVVHSLVISLCFVHVLVRKGNGYDDTREIQQIDGTRVPVVLELIVPHSCSGCHGSNDGVQFPSKLLFKQSPLLKVFALVVPFL